MAGDSVEIRDIEGNVIAGIVSGSGHIVGQNIIIIKNLNVDMSSVLEKVKETRADAVPHLNNMEEAFMMKISDLIKGTEKDAGARVGEVRTERVHLSRDEFLVKEAYMECIKYFKEENYGKAIESCNKLLEIDPDNATAWSNKGIVFKQLRKYKQAIECFDKSLQIKSDDAGALNGKAEALSESGRYHEAIRYFDKAIENYNRAVNMNHNSHRALINKHDGAAAWTGKAVALNNLKDYPEAIRCCNKALEIDPDNWNSKWRRDNFTSEWMDRGYHLADQGKYHEADKSFEKLLELSPYYAPAWSSKGYCLEQLGKYHEAIESYDNYLELIPDRKHGWESKGRVLEKLGEYDEADKCFDKADEIKTQKLHANR